MCEALTVVATSLYENFTLANFHSWASSIAYLVAACVAIKGLNAWKVQLKGNQDYKLAKSLMLNIYKYREAMKHLRAPAIWASDIRIFHMKN